jgi:hypothetical protein
MRTPTIWATLAYLLSTSEALAVQKKGDPRPRVVSFDIERAKLSNPLQRDLQRRAAPIQATLDNEVGVWPVFFPSIMIVRN